MTIIEHDKAAFHFMGIEEFLQAVIYRYIIGGTGGECNTGDQNSCDPFNHILNLGKSKGEIYCFFSTAF
jgi:hypothetical protein